MRNLTQMTQASLGNSVLNSLTGSNKIRSRKWCFTINNYTSDDIKRLDTITQHSLNYVWGEEIGEEKGTPHIQGFVEFKNARTRNSVQKEFMPRGSLRKAKGSVKQNYIYCSKGKNIKSNIDIRTFQEKIIAQVMEKEYKNVEWKPFQKKVLDICKEEPDNRKIKWFWEEKGNVGKSYMGKYLKLTYKDVILCNGKKGDIFNAVKIMLENEIIPRIILLDIPRSCKDYINYGAIEQLKGGYLYSGKYEGGDCIFPHPHVICFANSKPDTEEMSLDRWDIIKI